MKSIVKLLDNKPYWFLFGGIIFVLVMLAVSVITECGEWFGRSGSILALVGFVISVRDTLLFRPARREKIEEVEEFDDDHPLGFIPIGGPVIDRGGSSFVLGMSAEPWEDALAVAEKEADEQTTEWERGPYKVRKLVVEGEPGRPMPDLSQMSADAVQLLQFSALCGVAGTVIWGYGDLLVGVALCQ
tara:strand:- start:7895 stop:8455 length:561 start_codon:yes stop_codon:yes gene_type:complete